MKKWVIKDWGCEVEIANYPLIKERGKYEYLGFKRNDKESSITCNIDGFLFSNDPSGKFDFGGELNSIPFKTKEEMFQKLLELEKVLDLKDIHYMMKDSFFNVHITLENNLLDDLQEVGRFCKWLYDNHDYLDKWIVWPFNYEKRNWLWNRHKSTYDAFYYHTTQFKTWEELRPYYACKKDNYNLTPVQLQFLKSQYKRPAVNVIQYYQSKTIEFRCFALRDMQDAWFFIKFINQLIQAFNENDLSLIEEYPKDYKITPVYPYRYKIKHTWKDYLKSLEEKHKKEGKNEN